MLLLSVRRLPATAFEFELQTAARPERENQEYDRCATQSSPIDHNGTGLVQLAR